MDTKVNYTIVGAFVIALISAITLGIIWLSSGFSLSQNVVYAIYMQESVSGLSVDALVEYNGVSVGTVKSIELDRKNPHSVEVLLNIKSNTPITKGTVATLTTRGLTGLAFIALKDKSTDLRPLVAQAGQPYPVIPTTPSIFMRLDTALSRVSKDLQKISMSVQSLLDKDNLQSIKDILSNMRDITGNIAKNNNQMNAIFGNTARATQQFQPVLSNLDDISRNLAEMSAQIKQNPSILIRGAAPRAPGPGE